MDADLTTIRTALADLAAAELHALIAATYGVSQAAPGLLAWIDHACDREQHRRQGHDFTLRPPEVAIDPSEDAVSIGAAMAMRTTFAHDAGPALALFDALVDLLTGSGQRQ